MLLLASNTERLQREDCRQCWDPPWLEHLVGVDCPCCAAGQFDSPYSKLAFRLYKSIRAEFKDICKQNVIWKSNHGRQPWTLLELAEIGSWRDEIQRQPNTHMTPALSFTAFATADLLFPWKTRLNSQQQIVFNLSTAEVENKGFIPNCYLWKC